MNDRYGKWNGGLPHSVIPCPPRHSLKSSISIERRQTFFFERCDCPEISIIRYTGNSVYLSDSQEIQFQMQLRS